jgi:fumarylacetoacetase
MTTLDHTHNPALTSWVTSANAADSDFPIQNLPYGRFKITGDTTWRIGVAIGDQVLDLQAAGLIGHADMAPLMSQTPAQLTKLRHAIVDGLKTDSRIEAAFAAALHPQAAVTLGLPCEIGDYTDFYTTAELRAWWSVARTLNAPVGKPNRRTWMCHP